VNIQVSVAEWLARLMLCERIQVRIMPLTVVFIATAAAIYSLEHRLCTFTVALHPSWDGKMSINNNNGDGGCG